MEENEREKGEMRKTLIKPGTNARRKHWKLKKETNGLSVHSQFPEIVSILMVLDHKLRRDGLSSCEETASYQNRKEKHNLLAIPEYRKDNLRNKLLAFCFSFLHSKIKTDLMNVRALYGAGSTVTIT